MVPLLFAVLTALVYSLTQAAAAAPNSFLGKDQEKNDMYGTLFVFPQPHCTKGSFFKLQVIPRGFDPVAMSMQRMTRVIVEASRGEIVERITDYGEVEDGNSTTLFYSCPLEQELKRDRFGQAGALKLTSTKEILLHVLERNDSYAVSPTNALGTSYTIVSLYSQLYTVYFLTITPLENTTNIIISEPNGRHSIVTLEQQVTYTHKRRASLTGILVIADKPIFVISGMYNVNDHQGLVVEQVRPNNTWGTSYLLPLPYGGKDMNVLCACYAPDRDMFLTVTAPSLHTMVRANGNVFKFNAPSEEEQKGVITVVSSNEVPFHLLCLITSPLYDNVVNDNEFFSFRLTALLAPASVQHFLTDPCPPSHQNVKERIMIAAGAKNTDKAVEDLKPLTTSSDKYTLGKFWVRIYHGLSTHDLSVQLSRFDTVKQHRIWFQEWTLLKRTFTLYYLEKGSYVNALPHQCIKHVPIKPKPQGDGIDNDCDGLIDEEIPDLKDNDGDGEIDEDFSPQLIRNCMKEKKPYLFELNRYRLTRFQANHYEFARRLPKGYTMMVYISAMVGVAMVFLFIFSVWLVDLREQYLYPDRPPKIF